jgi:hypothetical protein
LGGRVRPRRINVKILRYADSWRCFGEFPRSPLFAPLNRTLISGGVMCFFIAGIQPKTVSLDEQPRMCHSCGLYQGRLKRTDHYISLFFIPLFPVKKGTPFVECQNCGSLYTESGETILETPAPRSERTCPGCGAAIQPTYRFCPSCGKRLR